MNYSKAENLSAYFQAVEGRLKEILPDRASVLAQIAGYTVRLIFPVLEYARYVIPSMFVRPDNGASVDATFIWWEDQISPYQLNQLTHFKHKHTVNTDHQVIDIFSCHNRVPV